MKRDDFLDVVAGISALGALFYISAVFSAVNNGETGQLLVSMVIAGVCLFIFLITIFVKSKDR